MSEASLISPYMPPWMPFAIRELGIKEVHGPKHNPRILEYFQATNLKASDDETPWCSAFANWCMLKSGITGSGKANARSWLLWGSQIKKAPPYGCIVVLKRGKSEWQGHVGFLVFDGSDRIMVLGGNQSDRVSIAAFKKSDVLGYRWA